jgi:pyruvate dehydrogenase (quinone)
MESCDAFLMLGTDFPYRPFYPTEARIARVDIRPQAIGRHAPANIGVVGQVGPTLRALMPRIKVKSDRRHLDKARTHYSSARKSLDELAAGRPGGLLHPQHVVRLINEKAADDAIFTPDVGCRSSGPRATSR